MKPLLTAIALFTLLAAGMSPAFGQAQYDFEGAVPATIRVRGGGKTALSNDRFKDGQASLKFSWTGQAELMIVDPAKVAVSMAAKNTGVTMWICNEKPLDSPLRISIKDAAGKEICWFDFNMDFTGWRAAWIKYTDMHAGEGYFGDIPEKERRKDGAYLTVKPSAKEITGNIFIDRLSFTTTPINAQVTPDKQIPDNNHFLSRRNLWHWARLWEWEQNPPIEGAAETEAQGVQTAKQELGGKGLSATMSESLKTMAEHLDSYYESEMPGGGNYDPVSYRDKLEKQWQTLNITRLADGTVKGAPIVSNDETTASDILMQKAFDVMYRYAMDYHITKDKAALERFFIVADHIIWQGIDYGSGMGTNHHYGYNIRGWNNSLWLLRKEIAKAGKMKQYNAALTYWSGLAECRAPYQKDRDEIIDSWNTLTLPKITAAMLQTEDSRKAAYMTAMSSWMSRTMQPTSGTLGGLKIDGTAFHHGGHYPAYAIGAFSSLGTYFSLVQNTDFIPDDKAKTSVKKGLMAMRTYCNLLDWGMGISGRHPFDGAIPKKVVDAFGYLAMLGTPADPDLAKAYFALGGNNKDIKLKKEKTETPQGFFVFNYGAFGTHRRNGWMLTLKGYNSDVWSSEIYTNDNRYGRYLSYGSAQLINSGSPASAKNSRFEEAGWNWNRIPGTTTIQLPFDLLNSPLKGTLMERNTSRFPGVSSLEGRNGMLAFTNTEKDRPGFCAGAASVKTVFCFDNRIVFIGTGITNTSTYPTETTLFQEKLQDKYEAMIADGEILKGFPQTWSHAKADQAVIEDLKGNCYIIPEARNLKIIRQEQTSPDNRMKKQGTGDFVSAVLEHGVSPKEAFYEYLMLVEPSASEISKMSKKLPYAVIQKDNAAHVVRDSETGITGYASYSGYENSATLVKAIEAETIVMERTRPDGEVVISICTPDLGITEKDYTTPQESQPIIKTITLNGSYELASPYSDTTFGTKAETKTEGAQATTKVDKTQTDKTTTTIKVTCRNGHPVELTLKKK